MKTWIGLILFDAAAAAKGGNILITNGMVRWCRNHGWYSEMASYGFTDKCV